MTNDAMIMAYLRGVMRGSQDDLNRAKADAEYVKKHGPIKRIMLRVGDKVTVYEVDPKKSRRRR